MPRKKIIYTHEFPYHVFARSNNREWFYVPQKVVWNIFVDEINRIFTDYKMSLYAFVLMSNHYHMLVRAHAEYPLGEVMCELQKSVSRRINKLAGRSNHVFGGPYRAGIVKHDADFLEILKYIYRNPVKAGIVSKVQFYDYSTLTNSQMPIAPFCENVLRALPLDILAWLNTPLDSEKEECVKKALKRSEFKIYIPRGY